VTGSRGVEAHRVRKGGVACGSGSRVGGAAAGSRRLGLVEEAVRVVVGMKKKEEVGWEEEGI
jgi:hypothetical protein